MTIKILTREEFQHNFVWTDSDFYDHLSPERFNEIYQKILEREYLKHVDEQVQHIRSIEI